MKKSLLKSESVFIRDGYSLGVLVTEAGGKETYSFVRRTPDYKYEPMTTLSRENIKILMPTLDEVIAHYDEKDRERQEGWAKDRVRAAEAVLQEAKSKREPVIA